MNGISYLYPKLLYRQCCGQVFQRSIDRIPFTTLLISCAQLHMQVTPRGCFNVNGWGNEQTIGSTVSDAIVRSNIIIIIHRLQLLAAHCSSSVSLLQVVVNLTSETVGVDSPLGAPGNRRLKLYSISTTVSLNSNDVLIQNTLHLL